MERGSGYRAAPAPGSVAVLEEGRKPKPLDRIGTVLGNVAYVIVWLGLLIVPLLAVLVKEARILLGWALQ